MAARRIALLAGPLVAAALLWSGCGSSEQATLPQSNLPPAKHYPAPLRVVWGDAATDQPSAVLLLLPGGGWKPFLPNYQFLLALARPIQAGGVATATVLYSTGTKGFREIEGIYEQARRRYPGVPICALGLSAGAHLALMLASREPDLACVIDQGGPTDLRTLGEQGAQSSYTAAVQIFGRSHLARWSPVRVARSIRAKVLMIYATNDHTVPYGQATELKRALPSAELITLPPGSAQFVHSPVDPKALAAANQRQSQFLTQVAAKR